MLDLSIFSLNNYVGANRTTAVNFMHLSIRPFWFRYKNESGDARESPNGTNFIRQIGRMDSVLCVCPGNKRQKPRARTTEDSSPQWHWELNYGLNFNNDETTTIILLHCSFCHSPGDRCPNCDERNTIVYVIVREPFNVSPPFAVCAARGSRDCIHERGHQRETEKWLQFLSRPDQEQIVSLRNHHLHTGSVCTAYEPFHLLFDFCVCRTFGEQLAVVIVLRI